jgi:hypothetical protein
MIRPTMDKENGVVCIQDGITVIIIFDHTIRISQHVQCARRSIYGNRNERNLHFFLTSEISGSGGSGGWVQRLILRSRYFNAKNYRSENRMQLLEFKL